MLSLAIFGICVGLSFVCWGTIATQYLWPRLRTLPRSRALRLLLLVHCFRFIGLAFVVPGVVSPALPAEFARPPLVQRLHPRPLLEQVVYLSREVPQGSQRG